MRPKHSAGRQSGVGPTEIAWFQVDANDGTSGALLANQIYSVLSAFFGLTQRLVRLLEQFVNR